MYMTDLEMHRWVWFHDIARKPNDGRKEWSSYWKTQGAFVSILPRQSGKTTMLRKLISLSHPKNYLARKDSLEEVRDYLVVTCFDNAKYSFTNFGLLNVMSIGNIDRIVGTKTENINLFIDEFTFIKQEYLDSLLSYPWKTVTMVGSLR